MASAVASDQDDVTLWIEALIPVGDMSLVLAAKGSARIAFAVYGLTTAITILTAIPNNKRSLMIHAVSIWLLVAAFLGAGLVNAIGAQGAKSDFVRWGYPSWWNLLTAALEMICAILIALPVGRVLGLALGAVIIAAAILTVLRHRDFSHLAPLGLFVVLMAAVAAST